MITICQGTPGSGKSAVATAKAIRHIQRGGVVAANFALVDGWSDIVAASMYTTRLSDSRRYDKSASMFQRFYYVDSLPAIKEINPRSLSTWLYEDDGKYSEGNGLLILDEAQLIFNSRRWNNNFAWIEFFTQHRKLGWDVFLIAHSIEMIDSQIRPLCEYESRFRNLQKARIPLIGMPPVPYPTFLIITRYAGLAAGAGSVFNRELVPLPLWAAKLYDSLLVFDADRWQMDSLPHLCGNPPVSGTTVGLIDKFKDWFKPFPRLKQSDNQSCLWSKWDEYHHTPSEQIIDLQEYHHDLWPITFKTV